MDTYSRSSDANSVTRAPDLQEYRAGWAGRATVLGLRFGGKRMIVAMLATLAFVLLAACAGDAAAPGTSETVSVPEVEPEVSVSIGSFSKTRLMADKRERHGSVILNDGRVLVVGGRGRGVHGALQQGFWNASAEVFDPITGDWSGTSEMTDARVAMGTAVLKDGRVLVAGGSGNKRVALNTTEIWDPATGTWTQSGDMTFFREEVVMVVLHDGRPFVTGGLNEDLSTIGTTEVYDPVTATWTETAPMSIVRAFHTATVLQDGRVLIVGGGKADPPFFKSVEIYDPETDTWSAAAEISRGRALHSATLLDDGRVLIIGGRGKLTLAEIYDPELDEWVSAGDTSLPRAQHTATMLQDGRILVVGGVGFLEMAEFYDPKTGEWTAGKNVGGGALQTRRHIDGRRTDTHIGRRRQRGHPRRSGDLFTLNSDGD